MFSQLWSSLKTVAQVAFSRRKIVLVIILMLLLVDARPGQADPIVINRKISGAMPNDFSDVAKYLISPDNQFAVFTADRYVYQMYELYSVRLPYGEPVKISGEFINGGSIGSTNPLVISSDSQRVVYVADQDTNDKNELYSVPIDGSAEPVKLNLPLNYGEDVSRVVVSPNGQRVVYLVNDSEDDAFYMYSVPITGPAEDSIRLASDVGAGRRFKDNRISLDNLRVVYIADTLLEGNYELYSVLITGGEPVCISGDMPDNTPGVLEFVLAPTFGVQKVIFRAYAAGNSNIELLANVIDDSTPPAPIELSNISDDVDMLQVNDFAFTPDSQRVVYSADQETNQLVELFSNSINGGTPVKLSGTLAPNTGVDRFTITPNSLGVLWLTELTDPSIIYHLYGNLVNGSVEEPILLDDLPAGRTINGSLSHSFDVTPNSAVVVYIADLNTQGKDELYGTLTTGGPSVRLSSETMQANGDVASFLIAGNAGVVYLADQETENISELYFKAFSGGQPVRLNLPLVDPGSDVQGYQLTPNGLGVVYSADLEVNDKTELYLWSLAYPNYLPLLHR